MNFRTLKATGIMNCTHKPVRSGIRRTVRNRCCVLLSLAALCLVQAPSWTTAAVVTRLKNGENLTVAAIGTSLTKNSTWFDTRLPNWLNTLGPGKVTIFDDAIGGSASSYGPGATGQPPQSSGLYDQLPTALGQHPDVVFIEFAINDAYLPYNLDVASSMSNLKSMIDQVLASGSKTEVVAQTMNNCLPGSAKEQKVPQLAAYYQGYRDVISTYYASNPRVVLVDNYPQWVDLYQTDSATWNSYVPDGLHPNDSGAAAIIMPDIQATLLAQAVPEPGAGALLAAGLLAVVCYAWRKAR
jgi:acyl-CoA thioesterase I